jgi:hypothetical protein
MKTLLAGLLGVAAGVAADAANWMIFSAREGDPAVPLIEIGSTILCPPIRLLWLALPDWIYFSIPLINGLLYASVTYAVLRLARRFRRTEVAPR